MKRASRVRKWREFEKLTALIERHLGPKGAIVRSPDFILDKVTGQEREVDASVRYQVGSAPILITIECRDRTAVQDVTWIEQLIAKRTSIGASATIAVSSTGFSAGALAKAKANAIEVRTLKDVSEDAIRLWAQSIEIVAVCGQFRLGQLRVEFQSDTDGSRPQLHTDVLAGYGTGDVEFKFIRQMSDGQLISIGDLLRTSQLGGDDAFRKFEQGLTFTLPAHSEASIPVNASFSGLFDDVPIDGASVSKTLAWTFAPGEATVLTDQGPAEISYIDVEFSLVQRTYPSRVGRLLAYDNPEGTVANVEQREVILGSGRVLRATFRALTRRTTRNHPSMPSFQVLGVTRRL